jgi:GT2 family glycosyltransferase
MEVKQSAECRILAVAALYKQSPAESHSVSSWLEIMSHHPDLEDRMSLLIYDNSPASQQVGSDLPAAYVHDPANGGLAAAYNYALRKAEQDGYDWLLLLDQDTTLRFGFLTELVECAERLVPDEKVAAIVPKLEVQGRIQSPAEHFVDYLRNQFDRDVKTFDADAEGIQHERVSAYNSGSTLRVSVLRAIGGFPTEFWLDYLDHAVFHSLCASGHEVYILRTTLTHELAESDLNSRPFWRFRSVLYSQARYVKRVGNFGDRLLYRILLLRSLRRLRADCVDQRIWKETALQALFLNPPDSARPADS